MTIGGEGGVPPTTLSYPRLKQTYPRLICTTILNIKNMIVVLINIIMNMNIINIIIIMINTRVP